MLARSLKLEFPRNSICRIEVIIWVVGEYAHQYYDFADIISRVWENVEKRKNSIESLGWTLSATLKMLANTDIIATRDRITSPWLGKFLDPLFNKYPL